MHTQQTLTTQSMLSNNYANSILMACVKGVTRPAAVLVALAPDALYIYGGGEAGQVFGSFIQLVSRPRDL
jgi:hypothetical protein